MNREIYKLCCHSSSYGKSIFIFGDAATFLFFILMKNSLVLHCCRMSRTYSFRAGNVKHEGTRAPISDSHMPLTILIPVRTSTFSAIMTRNQSHRWRGRHQRSNRPVNHAFFLAMSSHIVCCSSAMAILDHSSNAISMPPATGQTNQKADRNPLMAAS